MFVYFRMTLVLAYNKLAVKDKTFFYINVLKFKISSFAFQSPVIYMVGHLKWIEIDLLCIHYIFKNIQD